MNSKLKAVTEILKKYDQEHLLAFYDELDDEKKEFLLDQILGIDFEQLNSLYKNSFLDTPVNKEAISPLPHIDKLKLTKEQKEHFKQIGRNAIENGELAVITLSGGQRNKTSATPVLKELLN